jgi:hypothetical protein
MALVYSGWDGSGTLSIVMRGFVLLVLLLVFVMAAGPVAVAFAHCGGESLCDTICGIPGIANSRLGVARLSARENIMSLWPPHVALVMTAPDKPPPRL